MRQPELRKISVQVLWKFANIAFGVLDTYISARAREVSATSCVNKLEFLS